MQLSYSQLEAILVTHFGIHPDRVSTFRARIKQLQRLGFPSGINIGRGVKMAYSAEHLFQLATAFELIDIGLTAQTATTVTAQNWTGISAAFGYAVRNEFSETAFPYEVRLPSVYVRITRHSLTNVADLPEPGHVTIEDLAGLQEALEGDPNRDADSYIVLGVSHIARGILKAALQGHVDEPHFDSELVQWRERHAGYHWWMGHNDDVLAAAERLLEENRQHEAPLSGLPTLKK